MTKQSKIIKILSARLAVYDCPEEISTGECYMPEWCMAEKCDRIDGDSAKCWVRWAAGETWQLLMEELKPCLNPCCNGSAELHKSIDENSFECGYYVECKECRLTTFNAGSAIMAIEKWNCRVG